MNQDQLREAAALIESQLPAIKAANSMLRIHEKLEHQQNTKTTSDLHNAIVYLTRCAETLRDSAAQQEQATDTLPVKRASIHALSVALGRPKEVAAIFGDTVEDALIELAATRLTVQQEQHPDDAAVDRFAAAMKEKLASAREKGRSGWETCPVEWLQGGLVRHVIKGDPRDVANFCMMLWNRGDRTKIEDQWVYDLFGVWPIGTAQREQPAVDSLRDSETELNCAEEVLDAISASLDMGQTAFGCIGDYITAVVDAIKKQSAETLSPAITAIAADFIITLRQAEQLVRFFGGHDTEVSVARHEKGLLAWCTDYPGEGGQYLGDTEVDDELADKGRTMPADQVIEPVHLDTSFDKADDLIKQFARALAGPQPAAHPKSVVLEAAGQLVDLAEGLGQVVTIERTPLRPLAMGHAEYLVDVREKRGPQ